MIMSYMKVIDLIKNNQHTAFSFEVLPPIKGTGSAKLFEQIDVLREFDPKYINITTHRSEFTYIDKGNGMYLRTTIRRRPGSVAVAAAIKNKYNIPVVPHILCSGFTQEETEYVLIDLQLLGINDIFVLRGDKAKDEKNFVPTPGGYSHAIDLQHQINRYNEGFFVDNTPIKCKGEPFSYGVACYPEKHEESPNMEDDLHWLKMKVEAGAEYCVTQMFFDNEKYFSFVERARAAGITVPIIPGIKPIHMVSQLTALPKIFRTNLPPELAQEVAKCKTDEEVIPVGIEWCINQCRELIAHKVPSIHFYSMGAVPSIKAVAQAIY